MARYYRCDRCGDEIQKNVPSRRPAPPAKNSGGYPDGSSRKIPVRAAELCDGCAGKFDSLMDDFYAVDRDGRME